MNLFNNLSHSRQNAKYKLLEQDPPILVTNYTKEVMLEEWN